MKTIKLSRSSLVGILGLSGILSFAQCTQSASNIVDEPAQKAAAAPPPATSAAAALMKDDIPEAAVKVPIDGLPSFGDAKALVTVVMFTDFECPFCAKASARMAELKNDYGSNMRLVIASNPLPMHEHADLAAKAFFAANEQGKGEAFATKLFAITEASKPLDDAALTGVATELGLDVDKWNTVRHGASAIAAQKTADVLSGKLYVRGTPTFFINGRRVVGARPTDTFRTIIDNELIQANKLKTNDVYGTILAAAPEATAPAPEPPDDKVYDVDTAGSPSRGPANAKTTVVIFADFECPYCIKAEKTVRDLEAQKSGQVRVVYKTMPLPIHSHAMLAAEAAFAAERQNKFWEYHDVLLQHRNELDRANLLKYAADLGLDQTKFAADLDDPATAARVQKDVDQAKSLGITGTPSSFVNGHHILGAQPLPLWMGAADLPATAR